MRFTLIAGVLSVTLAASAAAQEQDSPGIGGFAESLTDTQLGLGFSLMDANSNSYGLLEAKAAKPLMYLAEDITLGIDARLAFGVAGDEYNVGLAEVETKIDYSLFAGARTTYLITEGAEAYVSAGFNRAKISADLESRIFDFDDNLIVLDEDTESGLGLIIGGNYSFMENISAFAEYQALVDDFSGFSLGIVYQL